MFEVLRRHAIDYEVVVVNDGSGDDTQLSRQDPWRRVALGCLKPNRVPFLDRDLDRNPALEHGVLGHRVTFGYARILRRHQRSFAHLTLSRPTSST